MKHALAVATACLALVLALPAESAFASSSREQTATANCSTPLRLYDNTFISGDTVSISTRQTWVNLSGGLAFDNRTSSYRVGSCSVVLAAGANGSGSHYPRCLFAGCEEDVMATGWNNVISSVYLN